MEHNENLPVEAEINTSKLDNSTLEIAQRVVEEDNVEATKDLLALFNLNQAKKNVLRIMKLNTIMDGISDELGRRIENFPSTFTDKDLVSYLNAVQSAIDYSNKTMDKATATPIPQIQTNTQVNINVIDTLSHESKDKITDAVKSILSKLQNQGLSENKENTNE